MPAPYDSDLANAWRSERLVYRGVEDTPEDRAFMHEKLLGDPVNSIMCFAGIPAPPHMGEAIDFIALKKTSLLYVYMCLPPEAAGEEDGNDDKKEKKPIPIGFISLFTPARPGTSPPPPHRNALLGIAIADPWRGKGFGAESVNWALDFAFRRANLHRVGLGAYSYNVNAIPLYRRLGFVQEGVDRECMWYDRKWYDLVRFGMLESEWAKLRGLEE